MSKEIEKLKEKEKPINKAVQKMSLDFEEHENILRKINKEMQEYRDKAENLTLEIRSHSALISTIQEDGKENNMYVTNACEKLLTKHVVICKLLQQRFMSFDKLIESYNKSFESRERKSMKIETLEKESLMLSQDFQKMANHIHEHTAPGFIASQGHRQRNGFLKFHAVKRNVGNHFNPSTGEFSVSVDGRYKVSLTIKQIGDRAVSAEVCHDSGVAKFCSGFVATKEKFVEASTTIDVCLKHGDVLYSYTAFDDCECTHLSCVLLDV
ncbi:uncharacterized protein LOC131947477 [Physella acuta]|uniref:uncharacterized protein LOC131947477 n=1 Tax=Physella acuta TaxID=109671 RepID=UPI0027DD6202|nr:uncharacterized protein LOC131947477 [Physella acuta]XP_059164684.1 uncharacterized protein LOC131947477 [Physella acuta]